MASDKAPTCGQRGQRGQPREASHRPATGTGRAMPAAIAWDWPTGRTYGSTATGAALPASHGHARPQARPPCQPCRLDTLPTRPLDTPLSRPVPADRCSIASTGRCHIGSAYPAGSLLWRLDRPAGDRCRFVSEPAGHRSDLGSDCRRGLDTIAALRRQATDTRIPRATPYEFATVICFNFGPGGHCAIRRPLCDLAMAAGVSARTLKTVARCGCNWLPIYDCQTLTGANGGRPRIKSEARSASIMTIALICSEGMSGSAAASTTRRRSMP